MCFTMALATVIVLFSLTACSFSLPSAITNAVDFVEGLNVTFTEGKIEFSILNKGNGATLSGELGRSLSKESKENAMMCNDDPVACIQFEDGIRLKVIRDDYCISFNWTTSHNKTLEDSFTYRKDLWYGGPQNVYQYWPFNNMTFNDFSYILKSDENTAVAEPYWVTSTGFYILADKRTPLFISSNSSLLSLIAKQAPPYLPRGGTYLGYKVCIYKNVREAHLRAVRNDLGRPSGIPDHRMIEHPIWSTWVRFKWNVNESAVKTFAEEIVKHGFNNSQIEIDDNWETCYGSAQFNKSRFPDMPGLARQLHSLGFRITLWNHPFVNLDCSLFPELKEKGYFVQDQGGNVTGTWWDGAAGAGVVDFTQPEAAQWFLERRRTMMAENHIDGLKLDAGESSWLPQIPKLNASVDDQPNAYTAAYVRSVAQFGPLTEVRVGHATQDLPVFLRMLDKDSRWTFDNGLPTLLTTLFQLNLNGYPLVLPDMVGGNAYNGTSVSKQLFLRWLQANTFMPAIQFSAAPFDFDEETVNISKKFTALHAAYSGRIVRAMRRSVRSGHPVNPPIWWVAPTDPVALAVWDEYLLGEDTLVAPVLEEGKVSRDIYLPCGQWRDEADPSHEVYVGPRWLRSYKAPLEVLPYFTRVRGCQGEDEEEDLEIL